MSNVDQSYSSAYNFIQMLKSLFMGDYKKVTNMQENEDYTNMDDSSKVQEDKNLADGAALANAASDESQAKQDSEHKEEGEHKGLSSKHEISTVLSTTTSAGTESEAGNDTSLRRSERSMDVSQTSQIATDADTKPREDNPSTGNENSDALPVPGVTTDPESKTEGLGQAPISDSSQLSQATDADTKPREDSPSTGNENSDALPVPGVTTDPESKTEGLGQAPISDSSQLSPATDTDAKPKEDNPSTGNENSDALPIPGVTTGPESKTESLGQAPISDSSQLSQATDADTKPKEDNPSAAGSGNPDPSVPDVIPGVGATSQGLPTVGDEVLFSGERDVMNLGVSILLLGEGFASEKLTDDVQMHFYKYHEVKDILDSLLDSVDSDFQSNNFNIYFIEYYNNYNYDHGNVTHSNTDIV